MFENIVKHYMDFPVKGIDFIDIMPFLQDRDIYNAVIKDIDSKITAPLVATVEARGFLFAGGLLIAEGKVQSILPIRKKGKLPHNEGDLVRVEIQKEYGADEVFWRKSDIKVSDTESDTIMISLFDDLLATGGTAKGIAESLEKEKVTIDGRTYNIKVSEFVFLIELKDLKGREILESTAPVRAVTVL